MNLLNLGRKRWASLISTRLILGKHNNKNSGNQNGAVNQETEDSVLFYLQGIAKVHGEWYATRFFQMLTKFKLRDEEKGIIDLPLSLRKRRLYDKWCQSRVWRDTPDARGTYTYFGKTVKLWSTVHGGSFVKSGRRRCPSCHPITII
jgi:hypothetical protein